MTAALLLVAALILVAFGGFMAASEAALGVTSRADLAELGAGGRNARALERIADDPSAHVTAVVFIRVLAETTAAVLVAAAFMLLFDNIWLALIGAAVLMTGISFVVVGASPRAVGRQHATGLLRGGAPIIRGMRILLGPLAHGLVAVGDRITPGLARSTSFASGSIASISDMPCAIVFAVPPVSWIENVRSSGPSASCAEPNSAPI